MIRIYAKTVDYNSFVADMKLIDGRFVTQDEQGNDMLIHYSHDWSIDYIGKMVKTPAVIDEEGNVTTPAEMWDGERANITIHDSLEEWFLSVMPTDTMTNGTSFTEVIPVTPERTFAGDEVETDDSKVDKSEIAFEAGLPLQVGRPVLFEGKKYRTGVGHTTKAHWTPDIVPWFTEIPEEGSLWVQPTGAHDAYQAGDIVTYKGQKWISKIDANTTIPDGDEPFNRYWEPHTS